LIEGKRETEQRKRSPKRTPKTPFVSLSFRQKEEEKERKGTKKGFVLE
jgi:hypothetical protein